MKRKKERVIALLVLALVVPAQATQGPAGIVLMPTPHPPLPTTLSRLWFAPDPTQRAEGAAVSVAMRQVAQGEYAKALPVLSRPASHEGPLGLYAMFDMAIAQLRLGRAAEAKRAFERIQDRRPVGYLAEAAALGEAECEEALNEWASAVSTYEKVLKGKPLSPDEILMRLGRAARRAGQSTKANEAFVRVYYEFASSPLASEAATELATINLRAIESGSERFKLELGRAERLFAAGQHGPARTAFLALNKTARGDERDLVALRLAQTTYYLKRPREARDALLPLLNTQPRQAEALYFYALALRDLGNEAAYIKTVRQLSDEFPTDTWSAEGLNHLATHYIRRDDEANADAVFRELLEKHPRIRHAERAAWKVGWRAYRERKYRDTVTHFERGAAAFPRSDYRPSWLYWSGRAHEALGDSSTALERYHLVTTDYLNSYYGRLVLKRPGVRPPHTRIVVPSEGEAGAVVIAQPPPNEGAIRALAAAGLHEKAASELRYAQRVWGDSPAIQATLSWVSYEQGIANAGSERFSQLRGSITMMRRAYPQFLAAGGEQLPREVLAKIFPLAYWDPIRRYSSTHNLDPYLMAALMAQESTFVADVRSAANAVGLMQLIPSTARRMATKLGMRYSSRLLIDPDANMRMGMAYFADKIKEFGAVHLALASYNAGETPVRRWIAERPGLPVDEFIDDIPYAETQNYVKRIIGTAEDYRRLYGQ